MKKEERNMPAGTVLIHWIMTCIIILLIPVVSIIINFLISRRIIDEHVRDSHGVIVSSLQDDIDDKLRSINNLSYLLILDNNFLKLPESADDHEFFQRAQVCYDVLNNYRYIHNDMGIMLYYPSRDYIVTGDVSNSSLSIYTSMHYTYRGGMPSYEDWMSVIRDDYTKSRFFMSDYCNYNLAGSPSFVFACTNPFVSRQELNYNILVTTSSRFINTSMEDLAQHTFFICDSDGNVLYCFGDPLEGVMSIPPAALDGHTTLKLSGRNYFTSSMASDVTDWYYVLCTPSSLYLKDSADMLKITLISTFAALAMGILVVIFTQYRNYRPVKRLVESIPDTIKEAKNNEFMQLEAYQEEMHRLNRSMQSRLDDMSQNIQKMYFYAKLKGIRLHTREQDLISAMSLDFSGKYFCIVSIYVGSESFSSDDTLKNRELLHFCLDNVVREMLAGRFPFEHILDEFFHVFFFMIKEKQREEWDHSGEEYMHHLNDFFERHFHLQLYTILSPVYNDFENTPDYYANVVSSIEEHCAESIPGVYTASRHSRDLPMERRDRSRYAVAIHQAIFRRDFAKASEAVRDYTEHLKTTHATDIIVCYNIYSMISSILMDAEDYIDQTTRDAIDACLADSFYPENVAQCEDQMNQVLSCLCNTGDAQTPDAADRESLLVRKIKNYIDNFHADTSLNVTAVADAMALSPNYMSKIFKNHTGEGLLTYINQVRIKHAKELLASSNINVDEIAVMAGFSNSRSFRRNFQNMTGITASDYRRRAQLNKPTV
ncbi:MAG: AraC family transcriptional regulator [Acetatifactor sp.]|nr:AraC family transcriptional regulator [Acetatifactor sp.]